MDTEVVEQQIKLCLKQIEDITPDEHEDIQRLEAEVDEQQLDFAGNWIDGAGSRQVSIYTTLDIRKLNNRYQ